MKYWLQLEAHVSLLPVCLFSYLPLVLALGVFNFSILMSCWLIYLGGVSLGRYPIRALSSYAHTPLVVTAVEAVKRNGHGCVS